ncbi:MAG TPA: cupin domain-containing protein [Luteibacter sp.]|uniref:cupin domain-containing protein n=1 Tax=Luteibacter sp. TaxID=1886636 RepID=UPI002CF9B7E0|nr:cupin domain-containing protein [Luteibacter sp.]HVI56238.1 cupin domain-containing protein [Luteibacter sp.]
MTKNDYLRALSMRLHREGGYFAETFRNELTIETDRPDKQGIRSIGTCIYYMLTDDEPKGHMNRNLSPIVHFFHAGAPMTYWLTDKNGHVERHVLGPDIAAGETLQLMVPAGTWKCSELRPGSAYGLLSESVTPGFEYEDCTLASRSEFLSHFPHARELADRFCRG